MAKLLFMACPECDLLHQIAPLPADESATCSRCGAFLIQGAHGSLDIPLALACTGLVLFAMANAFPLLVIHLQGNLLAATLPGCARILVTLGWPWLAAILITTLILLPPVFLGGLAFVLVQARRGHPSAWAARVFRMVHELGAWSMTEVFILGILVAFAKLAGMATVVPGLSLYALAAFGIVTSALASALDPEAVWQALEKRP